MPSANEIRDAQRATWAGLSGGWEKWDLVIMDQLGPVGAAMIERLDIAEDQQHLDIAVGAPSIRALGATTPRHRVNHSSDRLKCNRYRCGGSSSGT